MATDDYGPPLESLASTWHNSAQQEFSQTIKDGVTLTKLDALATLQFLDMMSADAVGGKNEYAIGISEDERRITQLRNRNDILAHNDAGNVVPPFDEPEITAIKATITALAWMLERKRIPGLIFPE